MDSEKRNLSLDEWLRQGTVNWTAEAIKFLVVTEQNAVRQGNAPGYATRIALIRRFAKRSHSIKAFAAFEADKRGVSFRLIAGDENSRALLAFGNLVNSGNAHRLRECQNCHKYWYCAGRIDQRACSQRCKVALWQRTPLGRSRKAEYMRQYRATLRRREEAVARGYQRKSGRKLHPSLKKGE